MPHEECHFCGKQITYNTVILIQETTISNDGIEADVEVQRYFCSEECKEEYT